MFRGGFVLKIGVDGVIILPKIIFNTIKESGINTIMISRMDGCLVAYRSPEWKKIEDRILALAEESDQMERFRRVFIAGAFECEVGKNAEAIIPPTLYEYAQFEQDIIILGGIDHFEIWSKKRHDNELSNLGNISENEEFRQILMSFGFH